MRRRDGRRSPTRPARVRQGGPPASSRPSTGPSSSRESGGSSGTSGTGSGDDQAPACAAARKLCAPGDPPGHSAETSVSRPGFFLRQSRHFPIWRIIGCSACLLHKPACCIAKRRLAPRDVALGRRPRRGISRRGSAGRGARATGCRGLGAEGPQRSGGRALPGRNGALPTPSPIGRVPGGHPARSPLEEPARERRQRRANHRLWGPGRRRGIAPAVSAPPLEKPAAKAAGRGGRATGRGVRGEAPEERSPGFAGAERMAARPPLKETR